MAKKTYHTRNPDFSMTIQFKDRPIKIDGTAVQELRMREPTVGDELAVEGEKTSGRREVRLFANLCECTPADIEAMPRALYGRLQDAFADFHS